VHKLTIVAIVFFLVSVPSLYCFAMFTHIRRLATAILVHQKQRPFASQTFYTRSILNQTAFRYT